MAFRDMLRWRCSHGTGTGLDVAKAAAEKFRDALEVNLPDTGEATVIFANAEDKLMEAMSLYADAFKPAR